MKRLICIATLLAWSSALAADGYLAITNNVMVIGPGGTGGAGSASNAITAVLTNGTTIGAVTITNLNFIANDNMSITGSVASGQANIGFTAVGGGGNTFTNTTTYGDANRTNAIYVGPAGEILSNAVGNVVISGGTIQSSGNIISTNGQFIGNGAGLTNLSMTLGFLTTQTNPGVVTLIDMPVISAAAGTLESYSLSIAGTNALTFIGNSDGTTITNPVVALNVPLMNYTNPLASWPKAPSAPGAWATVSSNGHPYMLLSTNGAAGSATWTATNKLGW